MAIKSLAIGVEKIDLLSKAELEQEVQNRESSDTAIIEKVDKLQKVYTYAAGLELKSGYIVIHANKLYVATTDFTTTTWDDDIANLVLTDSDTISCVTYEASIKIIKGQLVIHDNKLYICSTSIDNTTNWVTDEQNMIATDTEIDLKDYYKKTEVDTLLESKADKTVVGTVADLTTINKTDVVVAINELDTEIGDITTLTTTAKNSIVEAINEVDGKAQKKLTAGEGIDITGDTISSKTKVVTETQYNDLVDKGTDIVYIITD